MPTQNYRVIKGRIRHSGHTYEANSESTIIPLTEAQAAPLFELGQIEGPLEVEAIRDDEELPDKAQLGAERLSDLQAMYEEPGGWRQIKTIADGLGIPKATDGWDSVIPLIVEAEGLMVPETSDSEA